MVPSKAVDSWNIVFSDFSVMSKGCFMFFFKKKKKQKSLFLTFLGINKN